MARWTTEQTDALCDLYDEMLEREKEGSLGPAKSKGQVSKAHLVREFIKNHAPDKTKGSIEMKLMNISYARDKAGLKIVIGYKKLANCSADLIERFAQLAAPIILLFAA